MAETTSRAVAREVEQMPRAAAATEPAKLRTLADSAAEDRVIKGWLAPLPAGAWAGLSDREGADQSAEFERSLGAS